MADEKPTDQSSSPTSPTPPRPPTNQPSDKRLQEIFERARQKVKPIINREASNETISEDLLNFRMKAHPQE